MGIIMSIIGIIMILVGVYADGGYDWFTTRFQREFISREGNKWITIIVGILVVILGVVNQILIWPIYQ